MKRNKFSLSHYRLLTCDMGQLVPVALTEVLPGDTVQQATSALVRVAPILAPVMHPVRVRIHHWFVPHRLVWEDFEDFITGGPDGLDATVAPTISTTVSESSLADYLGLPTTSGNISVSALPFRGYNLIWNENYRDQDLQSEQDISLASGVDATTENQLLNVCWEKDFFTTARPWTQKGADITLPLGTSAPVVSDGNDIHVKRPGGTDKGLVISDSSYNVTIDAFAESGGAAQFGSVTGLEADLAGATAATVNQWREALALQRFAEARAKFGSRYTEYLRSLGVRSRDGRLDRPEYLGGGRQTIQFSEVLQTGTDFDANTGVGQMKGHGIGALRSNRYRRFFEEHGYIFTLMSVMPKSIYGQGIPKHWLRATNEDYFQKELQNIGQAEVLNKEVYAEHATPNGVFGYQDRYDEYRRTESGIAGEFRSTLNHWHLARIFSGDPALNASFVEANPTKRILASNGTHGLYCMVNNSIQARRPIMRRG